MLHFERTDPYPTAYQCRDKPKPAGSPTILVAFHPFHPPNVLHSLIYFPSHRLRSPTPVRPLNSSAGDEAGLRSVMVFVEGESAYGWLRSEAGVHRLVRNSPYDPTGRRHTSFSQVRIFPEADTGSGEKRREERLVRDD